MALKSVVATLNGHDYVLQYNSKTRKYEAAVTAPPQSSYKQPDHTYGLQLTAVDAAGNSTTVDATDETFGAAMQLRVLETQAPEIIPQFPVDGAQVNTTGLTIEWQVLDADSGVNTASLGLSVNGVMIANEEITVVDVQDGVQCSYTPSELMVDGTNVLTFTAADNDGNVAATQVLKVYVDTVHPMLYVSEPPGDMSTNRTVVIVRGGAGALDKTVEVSITVNGEPCAPVVLGSDGTFSAAVELDRDTNEIVVTARDADGEETSVTRMIEVDTVAPVFNSIAVAPNPVDAGATFVISVSVDDK